jgi:5'-3' exonuclease
MGINNLLQLLPGGSSYYHTFLQFSFEGEAISIDIAGLLHECARNHATSYLSADYVPSLLEFHRTIVYLVYTLKWDVVVVFDGGNSPLKENELARRESRRADADDDEKKIRNQPLYIALAAKICKEIDVCYVIAYQEADSQCRFARPDGELPSLVITGDSDLLAYGNPRIVVIKSWKHEIFRVFNLTTSQLISYDLPFGNFRREEDTPNESDNSEDETGGEMLPSRVLTTAFLQYGLVVLHLFAGCCGCDYTSQRNGLAGVGKKTVIDVFQCALTDHVDSLSVESFSQLLIQQKKCSDMSLEFIANHLQWVVDCYTRKGCYYDKDRNVRQIDNELVDAVNNNNQQHAEGKLNPRTRLPFSSEEKQLLDSLNVCNFGHKSWILESNLIGPNNLPPHRATVEECTSAELKAMIGARGGSTVTNLGASLHKQDLVRITNSYISLEKHCPSLVRYFNREKISSGTFMPSLDTNHNSQVDKILQTLLESQFIHRIEYASLKTEIEAVLGLFIKSKFIADFEKITELSPEIQPNFIYKHMGHIGESLSQKNIGTALQRVLNDRELRYHAVAFCEDKTKFYVISKQRASMSKDAKTRKEVEPGERPKHDEYLIVMVFGVDRTTQEVDGHTLGRLSHIILSYCAACTAGLGGTCIHCSQTMWTQYHHWGEQRHTPRPVTMAECNWLKPTAKPIAATRPTFEMAIQKKSRTIAEAEKRATNNEIYRNINHGIDAQYDVYSSAAKRLKAFDPSRFSFERPVVKAFLKSLWVDNDENEE